MLQALPGNRLRPLALGPSGVRPEFEIVTRRRSITNSPIRKTASARVPHSRYSTSSHSVYERAKEATKEVVSYIDEARYLMQDAANLTFLEIVFWHHRYHNLSIRLVTQTVDEFFEHPESEVILE